MAKSAAGKSSGDVTKKSKKKGEVAKGIEKRAGKKEKSSKKKDKSIVADCLDDSTKQQSSTESTQDTLRVSKRPADCQDEPMGKKKKKSRKANDGPEVEPSLAGDVGQAATESLHIAGIPADKNAVEGFALNAEIQRLLADKGITSLFDIQAACVPLALQGLDVVGRARTGCGKTLAFVLPIIEQLTREGVRAAPYCPTVLCLLPTRELAKQVHEEFEYIGQAGAVRTFCLYGGTPYGPQESALRRGVHIIVGTPGRIKDHIERKTLKLDKLRARVLDECDEMLNMGFQEDVEKILAAAPSGVPVQTFLFSATMPPWVRELQRKFLRDDSRSVDLVGSDKMKASTSVEHKVLYCHWSQRAAIVQDLVKCYGFSGRTIVFSETKNDANELAAALSETVGARALHGDIPQAQREATLKGFREGRFSVLVATDVAARGLDIASVELILQMDPPKDFEAYIHRSGRTGRAGAVGVCITLCSRNKEDRVPYIERKAGFQFDRIGAPQPAEMARVAARRAVETIAKVHDSVVPFFEDAARQLLAASASPQAALAKALARLTGHSELKRRSLITAHEGYVTFHFKAGWRLERPGYVFGFLRRRLDEAVVDQVKGMRLTKDQQGAVFDVPADLADEFVTKCAEERQAAGGPGQQAPPEVCIAEELPELKPRDDEGQAGNNSWGPRRGSDGGGGWGGRHSGGGGRGGSWGGGRGGGRGGGSGGRGRHGGQFSRGR